MSSYITLEDGEHVFLGPYVIFLASTAAGLTSPWTLLVFASGGAALTLLRRVSRVSEARELIPVLGGTARLQLVFGVLLALGLAI